MMKHPTWIILLIASYGSFAIAGENQVAVASPAKKIDLAFPESGIVAAIEVEEGAVVKAGEVLVRLDSSAQHAKLKIAQIRAGSDANYKSAQAVLAMNQKRLETLNALGSNGRANADEISRAETDYQTAVAEFELAREDDLTAAVQVEQIETEIERRILRSPIDGIVNRVYREVAESVTGIETVVVTVVNLDSLELTAHVDTQRARQLKLGQEIDASLVRGKQPAILAKITYISPVIDSSSDTVRVKLELSNKKHQHMSGGKYHLHFQNSGSLAHRVIESDE